MIVKISFPFIAVIVPGSDRSPEWLEIVARRIEGRKMERQDRSVGARAGRIHGCSIARGETR